MPPSRIAATAPMFGPRSCSADSCELPDAVPLTTTPFPVSTWLGWRAISDSLGGVRNGRQFQWAEQVDQLRCPALVSDCDFPVIRTTFLSR